MEKKPKYLWAILIPTIENRKEMFDALYATLNKQIKDLNMSDSIHIDVFSDRIGENSTGAKRNSLVANADATYVSFIDDDDEVSTSYVAEISECLMTGDVDCVTFNGLYIHNGNITRFEISLNNGYLDHISHLERPLNHLCPIKKSLAVQAPYPNVFSGEDFNYSIQLKNKKIVKTETHLKSELYYYKYVSEKDTTEVQTGKRSVSSAIKGQIESTKLYEQPNLQTQSRELTAHEKQMGYGRPIVIRHRG